MTEEKGKEIQLTGGFDLRPQSLEQAMQFAKLMADSDLVPKDFRGKPGNVIIAVQMAAELGISPMQGIQNIAVINGRPGIYGDLGKAILLSKGCKIEERDVVETKAKGQAWCRITRPNGAVIERTFSLEDAKTAGLWGKQGPWTTNPYRQMAWRAFWFAGRDGAADLLKGMAGAEELLDYPQAVETVAIPMPKRLDPAAPKVDTAPVASAPDNTPNPEGQAPVEAIAHIADVKRFADGHFEVVDSEGVVYATTEESIAKAAKDSKGTVRTILFQPVDGKAPVLMSVLPVAVKA